MNTNILMIGGAVVLAAGCYAIMRLRRHSVKECLCFSGGVLGMIVVLSIIRTAAF